MSEPILSPRPSSPRTHGQPVAADPTAPSSSRPPQATPRAHPYVRHRQWAMQAGYVTPHGDTAGFVGLLPCAWVQRDYFLALVALNRVVGRLEERVMGRLHEPAFQAQMLEASGRLYELQQHTRELTREMYAMLDQGRRGSGPGATPPSRAAP